MLCVFGMYEVVRTLDQRAREEPKTVGVRLGAHKAAPRADADRRRRELRGWT